MKQAKKIFTRILLNNWGGIEHRILELNEYVNLFCGKSGSGKSTVMDAIQVVLYGSLAANFLNKAADDAKNRRSVFSYLRGEQKDGTANRENRDFCAQIVLEVKDTGNQIVNCVGITFEVGKNDQDIKNYCFFSHSGKIPEDEYLTEQKVPYSVSEIRKLVKARQQSRDNRGRGDVNRIYPSKEAYLNTLNDVILGYIHGARFVTMEKSSIALKMTNGTGQFIRDYMFPQSSGNAIEKISDQLGAYREIKERIDDLEKRIQMLNEVSEAHRKLVRTEEELVTSERILNYLEIRDLKNHLNAYQMDLEEAKKKLQMLQAERAELEEQEKSIAQSLTDVKAHLLSSDCAQKEKELDEMEKTIGLLRGNSEDWSRIVQGLRVWETDEVVTDYVSNPMLNLIQRFQTGTVSEDDCIQMKKRIQETMENIDERLDSLAHDKRELTRELEEKSGIVEDLKNDRKPYDKKLKQARTELEQALTSRYGKRVPVYILADLFDVLDEEWKNAIEGRLGRLKKSLVTAPEYAHEAAALFRKMKRFEEVDLINSAAIKKDQPKVEKNSLYEAVHTEKEFADFCLRRFLGRIIRCKNVEELEMVRDGVTPDCYSYSNFIFRHLRTWDYDLGACIGTTVSKSRLKELEEEVEMMTAELAETTREYAALKRSNSYEKMNQEVHQLLELSRASERLQGYLEKRERLQKEIEKLKTGDLIRELEMQKTALEKQQKEIQLKSRANGTQLFQMNEKKGRTEGEIRGIEEKLNLISAGFVMNEALQSEVEERLCTQTESACRNQIMKRMEDCRKESQSFLEERGKARMRFNREYPSLGFSGEEKKNDVYDQLLEHYRTDFEPQYQKEFQKQCDQVYQSLRDNVIASIHGEIKAAYRHMWEINRMLADIHFADSIYQIDIVPAENENGQFYEMLMAAELDTKGDFSGMDGQISFGDDEFYQKYQQKIDLLTEKFMPLREEERQKQSSRRLEMEQYADYRNYLTFHMYERTMDENGNEKKNRVDDMAGRDSGGEGQNPKYVALFAGFAMLYMQQSTSDSKIRLVLLDEAFSKMDKERSEVCLRYARKLDLQLIVCVPDERLQSLIQHVDCVYGFRRFQNRISMMHIDKGDYLKLLEGGETNAESARDNESAGTGA